jgi:hypothetical protein
MDTNDPSLGFTETARPSVGRVQTSYSTVQTTSQPRILRDFVSAERMEEYGGMCVLTIISS